MNRRSAEQLASLLSAATAQANASLRTVMTNEGLGMANVYGRLVGEFLGNSYTNILAPLWQAFPELEPESMKGSHVEPQPVLSQESQAAIRVALENAKVAINFVKANIPPSEQQQFFKFDGLAEVEATVARIELFLQQPRFRDNGKSSV